MSSSTAATRTSRTTSGARATLAADAASTTSTSGRAAASGARARLLPDGRRPARRGRAADAHLPHAGARSGSDPPTEGLTGRHDGARRVPALRSGGRRPLRQDDSQRHRVRADAVVRRRVRHPAHASSDGLPDEQRYDLDLAEIAEVWRRGSVVSSWLLDLAAMALAKDPQLDQFTGHVADSGEGRWTVAAAIEEASAGRRC